MDQTTLPKLPRRPVDGHKGTFGTVGIIGGSAGNPGEAEDLRARMIGAPALVAMGANRSGCGLVKIGTAEPILDAVLTLAPMATGYPIGITADGELIESHARAVLDRLADESDALIIGPGLGTGRDVQILVAHAIRLTTANTLQCMVIDADAITALAKMKELPRAVNTALILTPHPGEARRLLDAMGLQGDPSGDDEQRLMACTQIASRLGSIVVLKGSRTVVSDGVRSWVCSRGNPCLGTGGTGDVLAGMIGSLAAQGLTPASLDTQQDITLFDRVCVAVESHARCGELWASDHGTNAGLDPRDLGDYMPKSIQSYRPD